MSADELFASGEMGDRERADSRVGPHVVASQALPPRAGLEPGWRPMRLAMLAVAIVAVACATSFAVGQLRPARYGAQADIVLLPDAGYSDGAVNRMLVTAQVLLTSPAVLQPVASSFGTTVSQLQRSVSTSVPDQQSLIVRLTVQDSSRARAVAVAGAIVERYRGSAVDYGIQSPVSDRFLTPFALPGKVQPRPLRDIAAGAVVGVLLATAVVMLIVKVGGHGRAAPARAGAAGP